MTRGKRAIVAVLVTAAIGGLIVWGPANGFVSLAEAKLKGAKGPKAGPKKGKDHLQKAYDALTDITAWTAGDRSRPPRELVPLIDQAKDLYRDAIRAAGDDELWRADELAAAAHDAARGLVHALRAEATGMRGIPVPLPRNDYELADLLRRTRDRLDEVGDQASRGPGRAFLVSARRLYDRARQVHRDDNVRAIQLARAAEAWTHVGEHLMQADSRTGSLHEPERRHERPLPPDDRRGPPPRR